MSTGRAIAVIAAHPDDEILGCGGTVARHIAAGHTVRTLIAAEGITSRVETIDADDVRRKLEALQRAARSANARLGVKDVEFLGLPDNRLDGLDRLDVIRRVDDFISRCRPDTIYTHHGGDLNVDHRIVFEAVLTACRQLPGASIRRLLSFEIPSSTEWQSPVLATPFQPDWFVDIGATLSIKLDALAEYESEMREWPHPRSLRGVSHLAAWRGATCGCEAAEAFVLIRQTITEGDHL